MYHKNSQSSFSSSNNMTKVTQNYFIKKNLAVLYPKFVKPNKRLTSREKPSSNTEKAPASPSKTLIADKSINKMGESLTINHKLMERPKSVIYRNSNAKECGSSMKKRNSFLIYDYRPISQ